MPVVHKLTTYADPTLDRQIQQLVQALKPLQGSAAPAGTVTPRWIGDEYLNTTLGDWYKSTGVTSSDWKKIT